MFKIIKNILINACIITIATTINEPFQNEYEMAEIDKITIENQLDHISIYGELTITKNKEGLKKAKLLQENLTNIIKELNNNKEN